MKTSSKILIGLLGTILLIIAAFQLDVRVFGEHRSHRFAISKTENYPIGNFKYVKLDRLKNFKFEYSDSNSIQFVAYNDSIAFDIEYKINNDTLEIVGSNLYTWYTYNYTLYTNSEIEYLQSIDSKVDFSGFNQDKIKFNVSDSEISSSYGGKTEKFSHFKNAKIIQLNSKISFHSVSIDTLDIIMNNSNARISKDIKMVAASIKSNSTLDLDNTNRLNFEKDISSRIRMR